MSAPVPLSDQPVDPEMVARMRRIVTRELRPRVRDIDAGVYPADMLKVLGAAGAFAPLQAGAPDLATAIEAMAIVSEECLTTAFCVWCQDALLWYIANSENDTPKGKFQLLVANGELLGGTGLSNPMKALSGIEPLRLKGTRAAGGWRVNGLLPWVSNLGDGHLFGICFAHESDPAHLVMALARCGDDGITTNQNAHFIALEGTATVSVAFRGAFIPDAMILADPAAPFIQRIRAGFILLQTGMALGLVRGSIARMRECDCTPESANAYLAEGPDELEEAVVQLARTIHALAKTRCEPGADYLRSVLQARLRGSELSLAAAQALMLHAGARGYVAGSAASRKLREAYFVAIVTPAIKHLRKDIAGLQT
ncbi:MAG TPA: acyl-CoA dehydrogenase family protein [Rhizomicrobium sp.]|nr:acyl-CoA dehydrogenase family protein [Rhizomicrobium sp.]